MSLDIDLFDYNSKEPNCLYSANITHNLGNMATASNLYEAIWRPYRLKKGYKKEWDRESEYNFEKKTTVHASELIKIIDKGLKDLQSRPEHFKQFDAPNGWGLYENFVPFVKEYLDACKKYPDAVVIVSR
jgi:hypothetical protein